MQHISQYASEHHHMTKMNQKNLALDPLEQSQIIIFNGTNADDKLDPTRLG